MPLLHVAIADRVYLGQDLQGIAFNNQFRCIQLNQAIDYEAYCDDFGPMNMSSTIDFIRLLDSELASFPDAKVVVLAEDSRRALTNAVFLLGAYMIIKLEMRPVEVAHSFRWLDPELIESYRDATYFRPNFRLHLEDCWRGLDKGRAFGWVTYGGSEYQWGAIDVDEYRHYDNAANGNLHQVVPGKFFAFQGPKDLGDAEYRDDETTGARAFSPDYYADILQDMGVDTVVQLNEPRYDPGGFTSRGLAHHNLQFEDCTCPPDTVVEAFLRAADSTAGAVAVHCLAGLGRTGTLIALWLMRSRGFSAREAMGWLRIMRPGSVIGEQQHYLCAVEAARPAADGPKPAKARAPGSYRAVTDGGAGGDEVSRAPSPAAPALAAQVAAGMARRGGSFASKRR